MTGFECFDNFVIHCAMQPQRGVARHYCRELASEL